MSEKIEAALTSEEWAMDQVSLGNSYNHGIGAEWAEDGSLHLFALCHECSLDPSRNHAIAALALHGQSYGFTWEDVEELERQAEYAETLSSQPGVKGLRSLAARIEALLPPRKNP